MDAQHKFNQAVSVFCKCQLNKARQLFTEAGAAYNHLSNIVAEKELAEICQLNIGVCLYSAGNYQEAGTLTYKLLKSNPTFTPTAFGLANELLSEATKRKKQSYWDTVKGDYSDMKRRNLHKDIIILLRNNPYYLTEFDLAKQMRDSCEALGMTEIAKSFNEDCYNLSSIMASAFI